MNLKVIIHKAKEGGFWAEVPALSGCFTEAETYEELLENINEAVNLWLEVDMEDGEISGDSKILEMVF